MTNTHSNLDTVHCPMKEDRLIKGYGSTHPMKWLFFSIMIYKIIQVLNIWRNYRKINVHQNRRQTKKTHLFRENGNSLFNCEHFYNGIVPNKQSLGR